MDTSSRRGRAGRRVAALVRHGHFERPDGVASAHLPIPLSQKGRLQARASADELLRLCDAEGLELDARLEASQLIRAWETATILADALGERLGRRFEVEERNELLERSLGSCANLRFEAIDALLARDPRLAPLPRGWRRIPDFRLPVPGAESLMQAGRRTADRIVESVSSIAEGDRRDLVRVFVAHGGCLRHAAVQLGALDVACVTELTMDHAQAVLLEWTESDEWILVAGQWRKRLTEADSND